MEDHYNLILIPILQHSVFNHKELGKHPIMDCLTTFQAGDLTEGVELVVCLETIPFPHYPHHTIIITGVLDIDESTY